MNFAILTSGGDAPGMNAAIRAFVRRGIALGHHVWGIPRGFDGLVHGEPVPLHAASVANILMTGGTILRTSRFRDFTRQAVQEQALQRMTAHHIDGLAVMGGNGSLAGAVQLSGLGFPTVAIPASIDNDMPGTDYSLGFDTAMNNIVGSVDKIRDTASAHERIFVVEVMGNRSGHLAIAAGLACGAEAVIIPERPTDYGHIASQLQATFARGKKHSFIIVAEGAGDARSTAEALAQLTGHEAKWVVLGHIQRGGPPTAQDRVMAALLASKVMELLDQGQHGRMAALRDGSVTDLSFEEAAHRTVPTPMNWLSLAEILAR